MKTIMKYLNYLVVVLMFTCCIPENLIAQHAETIRNVIDSETDAFYKADYESWKSYWVQSDQAFFSYTEPQSANVFSGWNEIDKAFKEYFANNTEPRENNLKKENYQAEIGEQYAFVKFDQLNNDDNGLPEKTTETRVLKKIGNSWKILSTEVTNKSAFSNDGKNFYRILISSFKAETSVSDIQYIHERFSEMVDQVDGMKSCSMLKNNDKKSPHQYTWILIFENQEAIETYEAHENHQAVIEKWEKLGDKFVGIDKWQ